MFVFLPGCFWWIVTIFEVVWASVVNSKTIHYIVQFESSPFASSIDSFCLIIKVPRINQISSSSGHSRFHIRFAS